MVCKTRARGSFTRTPSGHYIILGTYKVARYLKDLAVLLYVLVCSFHNNTINLITSIHTRWLRQRKFDNIFLLFKKSIIACLRCPRWPPSLWAKSRVLTDLNSPFDIMDWNHLNHIGNDPIHSSFKKCVKNIQRSETKLLTSLYPN